jgi:hypothetical protein
MACAISLTKHLPNAAVCATGAHIPNSIGQANLSGLSISTLLAAPSVSPGAGSASSAKSELIAQSNVSGKRNRRRRRER